MGSLRYAGRGREGQQRATSITRTPAANTAPTLFDGFLKLQRTAGNTAVTGLVLRRPKTGTVSEQELDELATWPEDAIKTWKRLTPDQQRKVVELMRRRYGDTFVEAFQVYATSGTTDKGEPRTRRYHPPGWFHAHGYQLAQQAGGGYGEIAGQWPYQQWWVHPSGTVIYQFFGGSPGKGQGGDDGSDIKEPPEEYPFNDDLVDCQMRQDAVRDLKDQLKQLDRKSPAYRQVYAGYVKALNDLEAKVTTTMEKIDKIIDDPSIPQDIKKARSDDWQEFNEVKFWVDQEKDPTLDPKSTGHEAAPLPPIR